MFQLLGLQILVYLPTIVDMTFFLATCLFHAVQVLQEGNEDLTSTLPMGLVHSPADHEQVYHICKQFWIDASYLLPNTKGIQTSKLISLVL